MQNRNSVISQKDDEIYDIAISFAGENREIAEKIATQLKEKNIKVFYDEFEEANLWGKNLYDYLSIIYGEKSRYVVMLLSKYYKDKLWTNLERQSAQAKAFRENREYILPIRLDDTRMIGIPETVGYIDFNKHNIEKVVELIIKKLNSCQSR